MSTPRTVCVLHPVVVTRDMEKALTFYRDILGLRVKGEMIHAPILLARLGGPRDADARAIVLEASDGSEIELVSFVNPPGSSRTDAAWPDAGIRSITFVVAGLDGMLDTMSEAGHRALGDVVPFTIEKGAVRVVYVDGPDGVIITLLEKGGEP